MKWIANKEEHSPIWFCCYKQKLEITSLWYRCTLADRFASLITYARSSLEGNGKRCVSIIAFYTSMRHEISQWKCALHCFDTALGSLWPSWFASLSTMESEGRYAGLLLRVSELIIRGRGVLKNKSRGGTVRATKAKAVLVYLTTQVINYGMQI